MTEYKTRLAPGAPWPKQEEDKPREMLRLPVYQRQRARPSKTDESFEDWLAKNLPPPIGKNRC